MSHRPTNFRSTVIKSYYTLPEISQKKSKKIEGIKFFDDDRDEPIDIKE
jgi:hypothetical protein